MPKFGKQSQDILYQLHLDLQRLLNEAIKYVDIHLLCGYRGEKEQNEAYAAGTSKLPWPQSKHNKIPSQAVDLIPWYSETPHINWTDQEGMYLIIGFIKGIAASMGIKIRAGADWDGDYDTKDQKFNDLPHIELAEPQGEENA
jgi:peptidoglycan L-alanyl-D-glutamate endopeptidase CwlK